MNSDNQNTETSMRPYRLYLLILAAIFAANLSLLCVDANAGTLDLEISAGANITDQLSGRKYGYDGGFSGPRDTVEFAIIWRASNSNFFAKLSHVSHLSAGAPFNNLPEDFLDRIEIGYRFSIFGRR